MPASKGPARLALGLIVLALAGCQAGSLGPPTIARAGLVEQAQSDGTSVDLVFAEGPSVSVSLAGLRLVTGGWSGRLVVLGSDATGPFLAAYTIQDGLPANCYVDNAQGRDRGGYIELRGILWPKASTLSSTSSLPANGQPYPGGTRFCFSDSGQIWSVIAP